MKRTAAVLMVTAAVAAFAFAVWRRSRAHCTGVGPAADRLAGGSTQPISPDIPLAR